jgi:uncharacterized membrane protein YgcG
MRRHFRYCVLVAASASMLAACDSSPSAPQFERRADIIINTPNGTYVIPTTGRNGDDIAISYVTSRGGTLAAGGHQLVVPPGAVEQPTWFVMTVIGGNTVHVRLKAWRVSDRAPVTQFPEDAPIHLKLNAANVADVDQRYLSVLYLRDGRYDGRLETQPSSFDAQNKVLTGYLTHFSEYCMGIDYKSPNSGSGSDNSGSGAGSSGSGSSGSGSGSGSNSGPGSGY